MCEEFETEIRKTIKIDGWARALKKWHDDDYNVLCKKKCAKIVPCAWILHKIFIAFNPILLTSTKKDKNGDF